MAFHVKAFFISADVVGRCKSLRSALFIILFAFIHWYCFVRHAVMYTLCG